jgi:hypothetical protein
MIQGVLIDLEMVADPYIRYFTATYSNYDSSDQLTTISDLPLDKRYLTSLVNRLDFAFCDFDSESLKLDLTFLNSDEICAIKKDLSRFAYQFWKFVSLVDSCSARQRQSNEIDALSENCE